MTASLLAPVMIDGTSMATMELVEKEQFETLHGGWLGTRGRHLWRSADGTVITGVWECDAGAFQADFGDYGECIVVLSGELTCIADADGMTTTLRPGDAMVFPRGWTGQWRMPQPLRKLFTSWEAH